MLTIQPIDVSRGAQPNQTILHPTIPTNAWMNAPAALLCLPITLFANVFMIVQVEIFILSPTTLSGHASEYAHQAHSCRIQPDLVLQIAMKGSLIHKRGTVLQFVQLILMAT